MSFGRVPTNIARMRNVQNLKKKLSKCRYSTAESRNSSKSLDKHDVVRTVRLKLGSENNAQQT